VSPPVHAGGFFAGGYARLDRQTHLCAAICRSSSAALCGAGGLAGNRRWSKALILSKSNVEGAKADDDFTSSVLGHDVILDTRRRLAGVSALARWNWSRGGWPLIACMTPIRRPKPSFQNCEIPSQPCEEVQPRGRRVKATINNPARRPAALSFTSLGVSTFGVGGASRHA
jgi:hypothetical protein